MKDDLKEMELDASTRKTATDWLMQVISGKKLTTLNGNGTALNGNGTDGGHATAVAVAEPLREEDRKQPEKAVPEFTAEDLCGAPVVPIVKATSPAKDEVTADDVCWVPAARRLKPQTEVAAETFGPRLHIVQPPAREPQAEAIEDLQLRTPETPAPEAPMPDIWRDSFQAKNVQEAGITAADISRDPAPYAAELIWNGQANHSHLATFEHEAHEITAADILRDGVREQLPEPGIIDLPSSFRVIRSATAPAEAAEAAAPVAEAAPESAVEVAGGAPEASDAAEHQLVETAQPEDPAIGDSVDSGIPTEAVEAEQVSSEAAAARVAGVPEPDQADLREMEAAFAESEVAPLEAEVAAEPGVEADIATTAEPEVVGGPAAEAGSASEVKAPENIFAREGFWQAAAGEAEASAEDMSPKSLLRGLKRTYGTPEQGAASENRPEGWVSAWKTLLRLGAVLPWVARALPALEAGALGAPISDAAAPGVAQETRQDVAGLRLVQYEIRTTVQDHSMQLKRMEEQLTRVRESMESQSSASTDLADSVRSMTKLVRLAAMGLGGLLAVLIVLVAVMAAHH
ncbi:MAG: hypothetical protein WAM66_05625 [Acidobacteriaceae bacterium]